MIIFLNFTHPERTMATASFNTLSPKMKANKSTSAFKSLKMASTVTETKPFRKS